MNFTVLSEKEARAKLDAARATKGEKTYAETMQLVADLTDSTLGDVSKWYYEPTGTTEPARAFDVTVIEMAATEYARNLILKIDPHGATYDITVVINRIKNGILSNNDDIIAALNCLMFKKADEMEKIEQQLDELNKEHAEACRIQENTAEIVKAYREMGAKL